MTEEMLAMTPYMMQVALNQTLQKNFKGKTYCGPGGEKELNFFEQDLPIDTGRDDAVDTPEAFAPYIITEIGDMDSPEGNAPMEVDVTMYICAYDTGLKRQGYRDVLNIVTDIMKGFRAVPRFGKACTVKGNIKGKMSKDDYHPYYFGAVKMTCTVANADPATDPEIEEMV